jgi:hypothetical protein
VDAWDSILNGMYLCIGVVLGAAVICEAVGLGIWLWGWVERWK